MHICIIGTGAAGWISYHLLKKHPVVKKITVIGSPNIATVGVGESTTGSFYRFVHRDLDIRQEEIPEFLINIDAAIKYGVNYEGWSKHNFLHNFSGKGINMFTLENIGYLLGKKPYNESYTDYQVALSKIIYNNHVCLDTTEQRYTYHFDAAKFIDTMMDLALRDNGIVYLQDTVIDLLYHNDTATHAVLESGEKIQADYFISCVGQTAFNQKLFGETYTSYDNILLTNKALFCPLEYTDKYAQFHPYTVARTMKYGWRWITPTLSRIGTGYAFSDRHTTVGQAIDEFRTSIGDPDLEPFVVDFSPRKIRKSFRSNTCSLGLAGGFLEPLDAPGLGLIFYGITLLSFLLDNIDAEDQQALIDQVNTKSDRMYNFWCSFILHQYKTCIRNDSDFWKDHKQVSFAHYEKLLNDALNPIIYKNPETEQTLVKYSRDLIEPWMFYKTTSGKDIAWNVKSSHVPVKKQIDNLDPSLIMHHRDYFKQLANPEG